MYLLEIGYNLSGKAIIEQRLNANKVPKALYVGHGKSLECSTSEGYECLVIDHTVFKGERAL